MWIYQDQKWKMEEQVITRNITWISNTHVKPNCFIICPQCGGKILFNKEEILEQRKIGKKTSTPCKCGWHPAFPPEPWDEIK